MSGRTSRPSGSSPPFRPVLAPFSLNTAKSPVRRRAERDGQTTPTKRAWSEAEGRRQVGSLSSSPSLSRRLGWVGRKRREGEASTAPVADCTPRRGHGERGWSGSSRGRPWTDNHDSSRPAFTTALALALAGSSREGGSATEAGRLDPEREPRRRSESRSSSTNTTPHSPSSPTLFSSSWRGGSRSSAETEASPVSSPVERLDPFNGLDDEGETRLEMLQSSARSGGRSGKRRLQDSQTESGNKRRRSLWSDEEGEKEEYPLDVVTTIRTSPSSTPLSSGALYARIMAESSGREDDEDEDDDDITLLPTRTSMAATFSSQLCSSPSRQEYPSSPSMHHHWSAMQRLTDLMDRIFEAEDEIHCRDGSTALESLPGRVRSIVSVEGGVVMLSGRVVETLVRLAEGCPTKSVEARVDGCEGEAQRWNELDVQDMSRLIKIMHRSLDRASGIDPFPRRVREAKQTTGKRARSAKHSTLSSPVGALSKTGEQDAALTLAAQSLLLNQLAQMAGAISVADGCLALLSKEGTSEALLCEEMVLPCLQMIKTGLENVLVPFAEACNSSSHGNTLLDDFVYALGAKSSDQREVATCVEHLETIFRCIQSSLPRMEKLLKKRAMVVSETMAFLLADSLLPCFSLLDPELGSGGGSSRQAIKAAALPLLGGGQTPMKSLRLSAIHVVRLAYERSEDQKEFIITTILDGMQSLQDASKQSRRQFGLANGRSICSSSALLLHIIQGSACPIAQARKLTEEEGMEEEEAASEETGLVKSNDVYQLQRLREGQDMARRAAEAVAKSMVATLQASVAKGGDSSVQGVGLVESFLSDLLDALFCPEWPASALLLSQLSSQLCSFLDDDKGSHEVRAVALEQLGLMAARLSESKRRSRSTEMGSGLARVGVLLEARDAEGLEKVNAAYWSVINQLKQGAEGDGSTESAARFLEAQWGREMATALHRLGDMVESVPREGAVHGEGALASLFTHLDGMIGRMVRDPNATTSKTTPTMAALPLTERYEAVMQTFGFFSHFDSIEEQLLLASNGPNATNRNKALRGLSHICDVDGDFFQQARVKAAVQRCLLDESVHVRDSAVGLLGRYALNHLDQLDALLPYFKERMEDTGLLVRKRTLRLLKDVHDSCQDHRIQVEAAVEIVQSVMDEEDSLRDLAVESTAQMWFDLTLGNAKSPTKARAKKQRRGEEDGGNEEEGGRELEGVERAKVEDRLANMVQVASRLNYKRSPVEEVLRLIVKRGQGEELSEHMRQVVDLTLDAIVASPGQSSDPVQLVKQVKVIALLVQTNPTTLSIRKAKALLPYLRGGCKPAEVALLRLLLCIFNSCLPIMPRTASSFATQLQAILTPLVNRPSGRHNDLLEDLIKCYCTVARFHTFDFTNLIKIMQSSSQKLREAQRLIASGGEAPHVRVLMTMTSLLAENADYDEIRSRHPAWKGMIDEITPLDVGEQVACMSISLLGVAGLRWQALHCLRHVCRSSPLLLMDESVGEVVEGILKAGTDQDRSIVLLMIAEAMAIESTKLDPEQTIKTKESGKKKVGAKVDRVELAGQSEGQGNPATFEIVSRYIDQIQPLAIHAALQRQVLDIIDAVVLRGICHPLKCLSTIIALQTVTEEWWISSQAQKLHRHLINKCNTFINFEHKRHARAAWHFQTSRHGLEVGGHRARDGQALFETWYSTIREQKKTRLEFVRDLVKAFNVRTSTGECSEEDVHYARFVAENLAALQFKTMEEVIVVASELQDIIAVAGEQVQISVQEEVPLDGEEEEDEEMDEEDEGRAVVIGRMSTIISIALLLCQHIRQQYCLTEGKIARGVEKKASNAAANRKAAFATLSLDTLPGVWKRKEGGRLAREEMDVFDNLLNSEGMGGAADDYEMDD